MATPGGVPVSILGTPGSCAPGHALYPLPGISTPSGVWYFLPLKIKSRRVHWVVLCIVQKGKLSPERTQDCPTVLKYALEPALEFVLRQKLSLEM
jgi:hypothetical protein